MREFYFVVPEEKQISRLLGNYWSQQNFLVSARQYFNEKRKVFDRNLYPFNPNKISGKTITDSGAFQYIKRFETYPFTQEKYSKFLSKIRPTYGVSMDIICEEDPSSYSGKWKSVMGSNYARIDETVRNCVKNIELAKKLGGYLPVSVIQGYTIDEYMYSIEELDRHNAITPFLGIGSIKLRKKKGEVIEILKAVRKKLENLNYTNVHLHAFGLSFDMLKIAQIRELIDSSDSASWIYALKRFHRVTVYNHHMKTQQEVDFGFGGLHDWRKYAAITFDSHVLKIDHMLFPHFKEITGILSPAYQNSDKLQINTDRVNDEEIRIVRLFNGKNLKFSTTLGSHAIPLYNKQFDILFFIPGFRNAEFLSDASVKQLWDISINLFLNDLSEEVERFKRSLLLNRLIAWDFFGVRILNRHNDSDRVSYSIKAQNIIKSILQHNLGSQYISQIFQPLELYSFDNIGPNNTSDNSIIFLNELMNATFFKERQDLINTTLHSPKYERIIISTALKRLSNSRILETINLGEIIDVTSKYIADNRLHSIKQHELAEISRRLEIKKELVHDIGILTGIFLYQHAKRVTSNSRLLMNNFLGIEIPINNLSKIIATQSIEYLISNYHGRIMQEKISLLQKIKEKILENT